MFPRSRVAFDCDAVTSLDETSDVEPFLELLVAFTLMPIGYFVLLSYHIRG